MSWAVYPAAVDKAKAVVTDADIQQAIAGYRQSFNVMPKLIALNPKNSGLAIPEGLELRTSGGCLLWELWLAESCPPPKAILGQENAKGVSGDLSIILSTVNAKNITVDKINSRPPKTEARGRKRADLPVDRIMAMANEGMGSKRIAAELARGGKPANYRTVARIIAAQQQGALL